MSQNYALRDPYLEQRTDAERGDQQIQDLLCTAYEGRFQLTSTSAQ